VCVEGRRKGVVLIFRDVEHASAEVLGLDGSLSGQQLEDLPNDGIMDGFERFHDGTRGSDVDIVPKAFRSLLESLLWVGQYTAHALEAITYESTLKRGIVATQKCLFWEVHGSLFSNGDVREEHELDRAC